jgi:membrane protease YdiL (CAAX protease family)
MHSAPASDSVGLRPTLERPDRSGDWPTALPALAAVCMLYLTCHWALAAAGPVEASALRTALHYCVSLLPLLVLIGWCTLRPRGPELGDEFGICRPANPEQVVGRVVVWSSTAILAVCIGMSLWLAASLGASSGNDARPIGDPLPQGWWLSVPLVVLIAPVCEELVFRGWLYSRLERAIGGFAGVVGAVATTSIMFAALHLPHSVSHGATLLGIAIVLGYLRARSGSVWPGMVLHAVWNAAFLTLATTAIITGALS